MMILRLSRSFRSHPAMYGAELQSVLLSKSVTRGPCRYFSRHSHPLAARLRPASLSSCRTARRRAASIPPRPMCSRSASLISDLVVAAAHLVNPLAEVIENLIVQPDGDPGLARFGRYDRTTFALAEIVFALHKPCFSYSDRSRLVARRAEIIIGSHPFIS
jgi:hypothetical protein